MKTIMLCIMLFHLKYCTAASRPCPYIDDRRCVATQACIRADKWCNGNKDCDDGSDEECCK